MSASSKATPNTSRGNQPKTYLVYPDFWKDSWGPVPLLGEVRAYDEFQAVRRAYDEGLLPVNRTFEPKVVEKT